MQSDNETVVAFTVPYLTPPSVNHMKQPVRFAGRGGYLRLGFKLTKEVKAYYDAVAIFARGRTVAPASEIERRKVKYRVEADIYLGKNQRLDVDNSGKCLLDGIVRAGVIHSDAFVVENKITIHKDQRDQPRTQYVVTRLK
jgi:Holliday junction resolvase RusA-like endonuclease